MDLNKLRYLVGKAIKYSNLYANDDFQHWKKEVVDKRLETYSKAILTSNVWEDEGQKKAITSIQKYQALKEVTEDIFRTMKQAEDDAKKKIKEIETS